MADDFTSINEATWSQFLERLFAAGVVIAHTTPGNPYLRRVIGNQVFTVSLPKGFNPKNPDASGIVGCDRFYNICRNLEINPHAHFKGWVYIL